MNDQLMIKADGSLMMISCATHSTRAYAMFRVYMPASDELLYLVRLYDAKTEGGLHLPGGTTSKARETKSEVFNKIEDAVKRCGEWLHPMVAEVEEVVMQ
jgi:hypothetical protein